jgi:enamine deaminase RidA (YjgF/YER057c/UK114 family)
MSYLQRIDYDDPDEYNMPFAPAIRVGDVIYCAGTTAGPVYHHHPHRDEEFTAIPAAADAQARATMENLKRALEAAGATFDDVVSMTRFLTDLDGDQDDVNRICAEYFGSHRPTTTTVEVKRLVHPSLRLEINAVAVVSRD